MIDIVGRAERYARVRPVNRRGGRIDKIAAAVVAAAFEYVEEAREVGIHVGVRMVERMANARLRRQMDHDGCALRGEQRGGAIAVGKVELLEPERRERRQLGEAGTLERDVVIRVEIVDADDGAALRGEAPRDVIADEARGAGDENRFLHHLLS